MVWWLSGVVDVWCGGCPILHTVWWMSGVMDVWCGGSLVWWMSVWWMPYNRPKSSTAISAISADFCDSALDGSNVLNIFVLICINKTFSL